jgi:hypothetical protein
MALAGPIWLAQSSEYLTVTLSPSFSWDSFAPTVLFGEAAK